MTVTNDVVASNYLEEKHEQVENERNALIPRDKYG